MPYRHLAGAAALVLAALAFGLPAAGPSSAAAAAKRLIPNLAAYCQVKHIGSRLFFRGAADHWACIASDGARWHYIDFSRACLMSHQTPHFRHKGREVSCLKAKANSGK